MGVREDYSSANLITNKEQFTMLAMLGFVGVGGLHRFLIALKAKDEQQAFLGGIYLLPLILFILLWVLGNSGFHWWYLLPFVITYILTIHDLTSMDRLLSGELSAKKAWYETWPGRVGAVIIFPIALWFLYKKTDLPKQQKNAIAGVLVTGLALFMGASFTGVEELANTINGDDAGAAATEQEAQTAQESGLPISCDAARDAGLKTPIYADDDAYAAWLDRDKDGIACE